MCEPAFSVFFAVIVEKCLLGRTEDDLPDDEDGNPEEHQHEDEGAQVLHHAARGLRPASMAKCGCQLADNGDSRTHTHGGSVAFWRELHLKGREALSEKSELFGILVLCFINPQPTFDCPDPSSSVKKIISVSKGASPSVIQITVLFVIYLIIISPTYFRF